MSTQNYVAYIGIDWADRKHDIALYDCISDTWQEYIINPSPRHLRLGQSTAGTLWRRENSRRHGTEKRPVALLSVNTKTWFCFLSILVPLLITEKPSSPHALSLILSMHVCWSN
jgi:hypothetical protein